MIRLTSTQKPRVEPEVHLTSEQTAILDSFVKKRYRVLKDSFYDDLVAADATMAGILHVFDNAIVTAGMVSQSRKRLHIDIPPNQAFRYYPRRTDSRKRLIRNLKTKNIAVRGI